MVGTLGGVDAAPVQEFFFGASVCGVCCRFDPGHAPGACPLLGEASPLDADAESRAIADDWWARLAVAAGEHPRRACDARFRHDPERGWWIDYGAAWDYADVPGLTDAEVAASCDDGEAGLPHSPRDDADGAAPLGVF